MGYTVSTDYYLQAYLCHKVNDGAGNLSDYYCQVTPMHFLADPGAFLAELTGKSNISWDYDVPDCILPFGPSSTLFRDWIDSDLRLHPYDDLQTSGEVLTN